MVSILWRKLLRDIRARRGPFLAVAATSLLGVALFGATYDAYQNLLASYDEMFARTSFADVVAVGGASEAIAHAAAARDAVAATSVRRVADVPFEIGGHKLLGRVVEGSDQSAVDRLVMLSGHGAPLADDEVLVEQHMAAEFSLGPRSTLRVLGAGGWMDVRVAGVVASAEYLWPARSRQEVFVLPTDFGVVFAGAELLSRLPPPATVSQVLVRFAPGADPALSRQLEELARANGAASTFTKTDQPSNAALHEDIAGFGELSLLFPLLFLGAGGLATYVLLARLVRSQRTQIGLLLANGFRRRTVFTHYVAFGLAATIGGAIPGVLLGAALGGELTTGYTAELAIPVHVVEPHPLTIVIGLLFAVVAGVASGLAPALAAARLVPAEAMRAFAPPARGGASLAERLLPPLRALPIRWRLVLRGIGRNRLRSASTVLGVVLAITLVLVSWGMLDTTQTLLDRQFTQAQRNDAELYFADGVDDLRVEAIRSVPGVAQVEPIGRLEVSLRARGRTYGTTLFAFARGTAMHGFLVPGGGTRSLPADGILVGSAIHDRLGVAVGDAVDVVLPATGRTVQERIAGFVDEPMGTFAYVELRRLAADLDVSENTLPNGTAVTYEKGADPAVMRDRLTASGDVAAYVDTKGVAHVVDRFMGLFYAFVGIMLVLGGIMAFALIFTTMTVNVSERTTEIATLRANGMTWAGVSRLLASENVLLTLLGLVPGLALGYAAAWVFMGTFSSDLFRFDLAIRPMTFVFITVAIVAVALISQVPALRVVRSIDVASELRTLSA